MTPEEVQNKVYNNLSEGDKAKETLDWLSFFEFIVDQNNQRSIGQNSLYSNILGNIKNLKTVCNRIIESEVL